MELSLNGFETLNQNEMMEIDGGKSGGQIVGEYVLGLICGAINPALGIAVGYIIFVNDLSECYVRH